MRSTLAISAAVLMLLGLAGSATAAPAQGGDGVTKASRAAEKKIENALKGRSMMRTGADMAITGRIKSALLGDQTVSASDINVDTMKGVVHLRGTVRSKAEAQKAIAIAKKTMGVKAVKSHLKISSRGKPAG